MQEKNSTCQKWRHQSSWREFVPATGPPPLKLQLLLQHYTHARGQGRAPVNYLSWFSESPPGGSIFTKHAGEFRASKLKECVQILVFPCFPLKHVDINVWTVDVNKQPRANKLTSNRTNKLANKQVHKLTSSAELLSVSRAVKNILFFAFLLLKILPFVSLSVVPPSAPHHQHLLATHLVRLIVMRSGSPRNMRFRHFVEVNAYYWNLWWRVTVVLFLLSSCSFGPRDSHIYVFF